MASQTPLADELARISRDEFDRYLQSFRPTEQKTIESLNDSTVGKSMDAALGDAVRSRASLERMRERYGVDVTPSQAAGEARQNALSGALGTLTAGNTAAQFDQDNRRQTLAGLLNVGQGLRQQALGSFGSASQMEGARASANSANRNAYTQMKAQQKAQMYQGAASLGAMALTAAVLM
jgi:hypothetical protein